ncbi:MAG: TonB family protein [Pyrinomonadaceae bacterium]
MLISRRIASSLIVLMLASVFVMIDGTRRDALAQQSSPIESAERERGKQLYERGDTDGAISALRTAVKKHETDADAWHYLGLALSRDGKSQEARKAFEEAVRLRPGFALAHSNLAYMLLELNRLAEAKGAAQRALATDSGNALAHYVIGAALLREGDPQNALKEAEAALKTRADFPAALLLKTQALISLYASGMVAGGSLPGEDSRAARALMLKEAAGSLDMYLKLSPNIAEAGIWREQLEALRFYAGLGNKSGGKSDVVQSKEVTTKVHITYKPEPPFTDAARAARISGRVVLQAVFSSDGSVKHILVLRALPLGLTEKAVEAARKLKFTPATKDGRPVSMFYRIEYNFN